MTRLEHDEEPLRECDCCGLEMYEGDTYYLINGKYYCEGCVEVGQLEPDEPDWDSMPGGHDDWRE